MDPRSIAIRCVGAATFLPDWIGRPLAPIPGNPMKMNEVLRSQTPVHVQFHLYRVDNGSFRQGPAEIECNQRPSHEVVPFRGARKDVIAGAVAEVSSSVFVQRVVFDCVEFDDILGEGCRRDETQ